MMFTLLRVILTLNNHWLDPSTQDSGSNRLKGWWKILHPLKSNREKQWLSIKVVAFPNKKKGWFSHKIGLVFVHGDVYKDWSRNSATFKMELFVIIGNDRAYNQFRVVFTCSCDNSIIFASKIKIGWKWPKWPSRWHQIRFLVL